MVKYTFTDKAERDIDDIVEYTIIHWGRQQAIKYWNYMHDKVIMLSHNPNIGIINNRALPDLYSFPVQKHVLYYLKKESGLEIVRILHANMDPKQYCVQ